MTCIGIGLYDFVIVLHVNQIPQFKVLTSNEGVGTRKYSKLQPSACFTIRHGLLFQDSPISYTYYAFNLEFTNYCVFDKKLHCIKNKVSH